MVPPKLRRRVAGLTLALVAFAGACGGDDGDIEPADIATLTDCSELDSIGRAAVDAYNAPGATADEIAAQKERFDTAAGRMIDLNC